MLNVSSMRVVNPRSEGVYKLRLKVYYRDTSKQGRGVSANPYYLPEEPAEPSPCEMGSIEIRGEYIFLDGLQGTYSSKQSPRVIGKKCLIRFDLPSFPDVWASLIFVDVDLLMKFDLVPMALIRTNIRRISRSSMRRFCCWRRSLWNYRTRLKVRDCSRQWSTNMWIWSSRSTSR